MPGRQDSLWFQGTLRFPGAQGLVTSVPPPKPCIGNFRLFPGALEGAETSTWEFGLSLRLSFSPALLAPAHTQGHLHQLQAHAATPVPGVSSPSLAESFSNPPGRSPDFPGSSCLCPALPSTGASHAHCERCPAGPSCPLSGWPGPKLPRLLAHPPSAAKVSLKSSLSMKPSRFWSMMVKAWQRHRCRVATHPSSPPQGPSSC